MLSRGKFKSLIMINWNGFFAQKFDLDNLVTTLSGGNGAGKSTTMASFITALIPDLSLLHFRNTTEAGSTSSSRDKGLHGKLRSGVCYAVLECENSRGEIMLFGVRLQQIAGRDKKVDLKLFSIQGLTREENSIYLFFEEVEDKAKILNINALKTKFDGQETVNNPNKYLFKQYHSIGDYHAQMFDYGFLPKRLRTPQDRSRFYRLIEASLYGGISSTITKSLREYLLPENPSVKRAFQDMEAAILENRMTLNKIEQTSTDRNFFRSLVDTSINYVASDYILQQNNRKEDIKQALEARESLNQLVYKQNDLTNSLANFQKLEASYEDAYNRLQNQYQDANEYYNFLTNAHRIQQEYDQQLANVNVLDDELAIAEATVEDLSGIKLDQEEELGRNEDKINNLRRQLADTQSALDQQQTRQVQYKQAQSKLNQLKQALEYNFVIGNFQYYTNYNTDDKDTEVNSTITASPLQELVQQSLINTSALFKKLQINNPINWSNYITIESIDNNNNNSTFNIENLDLGIDLNNCNGEYVNLNSSSFSTTTITQLLTTATTTLETVQNSYYFISNTLKVNVSNDKAYYQAYQALTHLTNGREIKDFQAYTQAQALIRGIILKRNLAERIPQLEREFNSLSNKFESAQTYFNQVQQLQSQLGQTFTSRQELIEAIDLNRNTIDDLEIQRDNLKDQLSSLETQVGIVQNELNTINNLRVPYFKAQDELEKLNRKMPEEITSETQIKQALEHYLTLTNNQGIELENLNNTSESLSTQINKLEKQNMGVDQQLQYLAQDLNGVLISEIYDDITIEDASYYSALYGPARDAIVVHSFDNIEEKLENYKDLPSDLYLIQGDFKNFNEDIFDRVNHENAVLVRINDNQIRYSTYQEASTFGKAAREKYLEETKAQLKEVLFKINELSQEYHSNKNLVEALTSFYTQHMLVAFQPDPEARSQELNRQASSLEREINSLKNTYQIVSSQLLDLNNKDSLFNRLIQIYTEDSLQSIEEDYHRLRNELSQAKESQRYLEQYSKEIANLEQHYSNLQYPPTNPTKLKIQQFVLAFQMQALNKLIHLCQELINRQEHFSYKDLGELSGDELSDSLRTELSQAEARFAKLKQALKDTNNKYEQQRSYYFQVQANVNSARKILDSLASSLTKQSGTVNQETVAKAKAKATQLLSDAEAQKEQLINIRNEYHNNTNKLEEINVTIKDARRNYALHRATVLETKQKWKTSYALAHSHHLINRLLAPELRTLTNDELRSTSDRALGQLRTLISDNEYLRDSLKASEDNRKPYLKVQFFIDVFEHLRERIRQDVLTTNDPIEAIEQMEIQLDRLHSQLSQREKSLVISAGDVASILDKTIQREQNRIWQLNQGLQNMSFGQVKSVRLNATYRESHGQLLNALREGREKHADLFDNNELSFTEALAKLYQRTNSEFEIGQRNFQTVGEELLDYRNYINLGIEVFRGSDGWLKAESGALSTGEAIGTGMSILLMVVQSWEEESRRIRAKDLLPCRLLLLDEAARLDTKSIATLFELCQRQQMQLLIAAPENISPDNGTTYKLVRRVEGKKEHVHVVGLRGFGTN